MTTTILGTKQTETAIDMQVVGTGWVIGNDLQKLPPDTVIAAVRRTYDVLANHFYIFVTEYADQLSGGIKQVVSRGSVYPDNRTIQPNHSVGRVDSPLSFEMWDITPDQAPAPAPAPTPPTP